MNREEVQELVNSISLPNNFSIIFNYNFIRNESWIDITARWISLEDKTTPIYTYARIDIQEYLPEDLLLHLIFGRCSELWDHEFVEQFKVRDKHYIFPHGEDGKNLGLTRIKNKEFSK